MEKKESILSKHFSKANQNNIPKSKNPPVKSHQELLKSTNPPVESSQELLKKTNLPVKSSQELSKSTNPPVKSGQELLILTNPLVKSSQEHISRPTNLTVQSHQGHVTKPINPHVKSYESNITNSTNVPVKTIKGHISKSTNSKPQTAGKLSETYVKFNFLPEHATSSRAVKYHTTGNSLKVPERNISNTSKTIQRPGDVLAKVHTQDNLSIARKIDSTANGIFHEKLLINIPESLLSSTDLSIPMTLANRTAIDDTTESSVSEFAISSSSAGTIATESNIEFTMSSSSTGTITTESNVEFTISSSSAGTPSSDTQKSPSHDRLKREMQQLAFFNPGPSTDLDQFKPEQSNREKRKLNRLFKVSPFKRVPEKCSKRPPLYDSEGLLLDSQMDICDCLIDDCIGCHFPCESCGSTKCGVHCRCVRTYKYEHVHYDYGLEIPK